MDLRDESEEELSARLSGKIEVIYLLIAEEKESGESIISWKTYDGSMESVTPDKPFIDRLLVALRQDFPNEIFKIVAFQRISD